MGIGAIGGVGTASYNPYVYNTNTVSAKSLGKVSAIPDDATKGGVDYSGAVSDDNQSVNINPLKPGQTRNFADVVMSQMAMSSARQADLLATNPQSAVTGSDTTDAAVAVSA